MGAPTRGPAAPAPSLPVKPLPKVAATEPLPYVPAAATSILDVGCATGTVLDAAYARGIRGLYGIDINAHAVDAARARLRNLPGIDLTHLVQGSADDLPFDDAIIDAATSFETLEHVPAALRPGVIREVRRVLRPGAPFVISVPAAGFFAWLDPANVRFRFPRLFRLISRAAGGQGRELGYEGQKHGIVWHHHFSEEELRGLLEPSFVVEHLSWRGCLVAPLCACLGFPFYRRQRLDHPVFRWLQRLEAWDLSKEYPAALACNVLLVARRRD